MRDHEQRPSGWLALVSLLFVLVALGLFFSSFKLDVNSPYFTSLLIPVLVASVLAVVALHLFYWRAARKRRIQIDTENYAREREFASVFEHTLDGILILDDQSVCKTANPAACRLLGVDCTELIGRHFGYYYPNGEEFAEKWKSFLSTGYQRGQMRLLCRDKNSVCFLLEEYPGIRANDRKRDTLTKRETEALSWVARGKTNAEIGQIMSVKTRTIGKYMERIFPKLGVENRTAAASFALGTNGDS